jgi:hypothetical protein
MTFVAPSNQISTADAMRLATLAAYGNSKALQDLLLAIISGSIATLPGSSPAVSGVTVRSDGNIYAAASSSIAGNAAVTTNTVLASILIPANAFDGIQNRVASICASGSFAANGNNKVVQCYFGPDKQTVGQPVVTTGTTSIATSGVVTTNSGGWCLNAQVMKYGSPGSNTQQGVNQGVITGSTHTGTQAPTALTCAENGPLYLTLTGASSTSGTANDVVLQQVEVLWNN